MLNENMVELNKLYFDNCKNILLQVDDGIQFDPNSLGGTIVKDGLDSSQIKTDANGNYAGVQKAIIPENNLQTLENLTGGLISYKSTGPMTAGSLTLGYEKDVMDNFFFRVGANFTTKISILI